LISSFGIGGAIGASLIIVSLSLDASHPFKSNVGLLSAGPQFSTHSNGLAGGSAVAVFYQSFSQLKSLGGGFSNGSSHSGSAP
jgi:hypothetical protein